MARRPFIGGNWKMNTDLATGKVLARTIAAEWGADVSRAEVVVFPPFPYLESVGQEIGLSSVALGAQDLSSEANGARTGEVSAEMLCDMGVRWVLVGHSERRHRLGESDALVAEKLAMALESGLQVVLCVGENLQQRHAGRTHEVVGLQLRSAFAQVPEEAVARIVIAYEPVWAIGTGVAATATDALEAHHEIRAFMSSRYDSELASSIRIVYGGSLVPGNAKTIFAAPGVDGGLVGGASLKAADFLSICSSAVIGIEAGRTGDSA
ncbi:MAG: triose-phosphate isomerase [Phycisphaerales bacterium]|nr:triose-phosphate isomerase [Phycisphaerales bacterium]